MVRRSIGCSSAGFTLFETLAATLILAIALTTIMQLFSGGLRAHALSNQYSAAIYHAREKMESILLADGLVEGSTAGAWEDGYRWQVLINRYETETESVTVQANRKSLFNVDLTISWPNGSRMREINLSSLALAKDENDSDQ